MNTIQQISDEQMQRVEAVIGALAHGGNAWGVGISRRIEGKSPAARRRIILGAVGQMWQAMLSIQMAMVSTAAPHLVQATLERTLGAAHAKRP